MIKSIAAILDFISYLGEPRTNAQTSPVNNRLAAHRWPLAVMPADWFPFQMFVYFPWHFCILKSRKCWNPLPNQLENTPILHMCPIFSPQKNMVPYLSPPPPYVSPAPPPVPRLCSAEGIKASSTSRISEASNQNSRCAVWSSTARLISTWRQILFNILRYIYIVIRFILH